MDTNRNITKHIKNLASKYPIIAVTGPRQSGKTTMIRSVFPNYEYVNLEKPDLREFATKDPNAFLSLYNNHCIFDEIQRVPSLFSYLQDAVDGDRRMGRFVISGSQNFSLLHSITQSLAGRVAIFTLFPFDNSEMKKANFFADNYAECMHRGFYPAIFDRNIPSVNYFSNYLRTYVERDITEVVNIQDMKSFRDFIRLCATRAGNVLNLSDLARDCGISSPTAKAWLSLLESSYIVFLLPPYYKNYSKRIVKSSKLYFYDTGLLCYLLNIRTPNQIDKTSIKGALFENYVIAEKIKRNAHSNNYNDYYYWRDSHNFEVDLLTPNLTKMDYYEIKCTRTISQDLFAGLGKFKDMVGDDAGRANLIHAGTENLTRKGVSLISWDRI